MERWVKANARDGAPVWVNMATVAMVLPSGWDEVHGSCLIFLPAAGSGPAHAPATQFEEPPEHFLPPATIELTRLRAFVKQVAGLRGNAADERFRPDADGIVRDAKKLLEEVDRLTARAWAERYS